jgi:hypothetical protein
MGEGRALKALVFVVNLQVPGQEKHHSVVFYYVGREINLIFEHTY